VATQTKEGGAIVKIISTPITGYKATALQLKLLNHHPGGEAWIKVDNHHPYRCVVTQDWGLDATQAVNPKEANGNPKVYPEDGNKIWEATGKHYPNGVEHFQRLANQGHQIFIIPNKVKGGIRAVDVQQCQHIFAEADDRPIPEQWERLQWFSGVTGLVPCLIIYSGGKSLHFYFALNSAIASEDWQRLQRKIILIFRSDPQIQNLNREMRLAGVSRKDKEVSVDFTSDRSYDPVEFEQRLDSLGYFPHGVTYERWLKARKLLKDKAPDADLLKLLATPEDELFPKPAPRSQPQREFEYNGDTIPLKFCLTRDDQELITHGISAGSVGRNPMGYKLARNAIGTADALTRLGIRHSDNGYQLLEDFCRRCNPPLSDREIQRLWKQAQRNNPKASLTDEQLLKRVSYWQRTQLPPSEAKCSSTINHKQAEATSETEGDRPISRDQWELTFGFGKRLRERIKQTLEGFKGFGKPPAPPHRAKEVPDQLFQEGDQRLQIWQDAVLREYRYILDRSVPGLGKSHAVGIAMPDAFGAEKLWYVANDHRNPTTGVVETNYTDLPVRHKGLKEDFSRRTPNGNPVLRHPKTDEGEEPDTAPNCYRSDLFRVFSEKGYNVEGSKSSPICATCKVAHLCSQGIGGKYGATFRGDRQQALTSERIRAHADSLPIPGTEEGFDYSNSGLFWDEIGSNLKPIKETRVGLQNFDRTFAELESKAPDLHELLKPQRLALRSLLTGEVQQPYHGFDDAAIRSLLPDISSENSEELIEIVVEILEKLRETLAPDLNFLHDDPDSISNDERRERGISESMQRLVNRQFKREAHRKFFEELENLPLNWLIPFLKVWTRFERGALRCEGNHLIVFTHNQKYSDIAASARFNIFLDATITREHLALLLGVDPSEIYVVGQETPNHKNLKIIQITGMGKLGKDRSKSLGQRVAALRKALEERYPNIVFGDWKSQASQGDGQWFVNLRGSNEFKDAPAMAVFGVPYQNIGYLQALYQTLTGEFAGLDKETPHEGLQRFIDAHVEAEIEQAVGRLRSHLRPNEQLTFVFVGDYDLSFLGMPVEQIEAFQITPEAGTPTQITRWKILEAARTLNTQRKKLTQDAIASLIGKSQELISKIASELGGWMRLKKLLLVLLDPLNSGSNNFPELSAEEKWIAQTYLPGLLEDESPEAAVQELAEVVRACGVSGFLQILTAATPQTQARILTLVMQALPLGFQSELLMIFIEGGSMT
jgi:hypothetical protein